MHDVLICIFVRYYLIEIFKKGNYYKYLNLTLARGNTICNVRFMRTYMKTEINN
jgi:hypothetical protein